MVSLFFFLIGLTTVALGGVNAAYDNFPIKSLNLTGASYDVQYHSPWTELEDPHPVHGIQLSGRLDGYFVFVGKTPRCEFCEEVNGFLVLLDPRGTLTWLYKTNWPADDVFNAVAQLPGGGDVLVVGYRKEGNVAKRLLLRIDPVEQRIVWTTTDFGDATGSHGAWESLTLNSEGTTVVLAGLHQKPEADEMWFKSYGNACCGRAIVAEIPLAALDSNTVSSSSAIWSKSWSTEGDETAKAVRALPSDGRLVVLLWGEASEAGADGASLELFSPLELSSGRRRSLWAKKYGASHGEGTDVAVSKDGRYLGISGHGCIECVGELYAKLTKVRVSDGAMVFSKGYMACDYKQYPTCKAIFNECWGIESFNDEGFILACGTGIENCEEGLEGSLRNSCLNDQPIAADPRLGAVPRSAGVWQSFVVAVDFDGSIVFQRADQFREEGATPLGQRGWEEHSSASEFVFPILSGFGFVQDESTGIGIMELREPQ